MSGYFRRFAVLSATAAALLVVALVVVQPWHDGSGKQAFAHYYDGNGDTVNDPHASLDANPWNGSGPCDPIDSQVTAGPGAYDVAVCVESLERSVGALEFGVSYDPGVTSCTDVACPTGDCLDDNPDANTGVTLGRGLPTSPNLGGAWDCNILDLGMEPTCHKDGQARAWMVCWSLTGPYTSPTGDTAFPLAVVKFQTVAYGADSLILSDVNVSDDIGNALGNCDQTYGIPMDCASAVIQKNAIPPAPASFAIRPCGSAPSCTANPQYLYLTWDGVPGADSYEVCFANDPSMQSGLTCYAAVTGRSFSTAPPMASGKLVLYWAVRAKAGAQASAFSKRGGYVRFNESVGGYSYAEYWTVYKTGPQTKMINGWNFSASPRWMAFNNHSYAPGSSQCQAVPPRGCEPISGQAQASSIWFSTTQLWDPPDFQGIFGSLVAVFASPDSSFQPNDWSWISTYMMW